MQFLFSNCQRPSDTTLYSPSQVELINLMEKVLETTLTIFKNEARLRFLAFEQGVLDMIVFRLIELCNIKSTGSSSSSSSSSTSATPATSSSLRKKLGKDKKDKENKVSSSSPLFILFLFFFILTFPSKKTYWEKGTGFGFGETTPAPMMEKERLQAEQRRKDKSIAQLLRILSAFFDPHARKPSFSSSSTSSSSSSSSCCSCCSQFYAHWTVVWGVGGSCGLFSVLETYLRNDSLLDMTTSQISTSLYTSIFVLLRNLAGFPELLPLLELLPGQTTSLLSLLKQVSSQSQFLLKRLGTGTASSPSSAPVSVPPSSDLWATSLAEEIVSTFDQVGERIEVEKKIQEQQKREKAAVRERKECAEKQEIEQEQGKVEGTKRKVEVESSTSSEKGKEPEESSSSSLLDLYVEVLKEQLFRSADMNATNSKGDFGEHYYASTIKSETGTPCHSKVCSFLTSILIIFLSHSVFTPLDDTSCARDWFPFDFTSTHS
jgi:hypothetical protein